MNDTEIETVRLPAGTFLPALGVAAVASFLLTGILITFRTGDVTEGARIGAITALCTIPIVAIICVTCGLTYHVRVYDSGVSSYNPWGTWQKQFLAWSDMEIFEAKWVIGVWYLRISSATGGDLWIPQRVLGSQKLMSAVLRTAPASTLASHLSHAA